MVQTAETIWRDFVTDGIPASGTQNPRKVDIREWGAWVESIFNAVIAAGGKLYASKAAMDADTAPALNTPGLVIGDATVANNGLYRKSAAATVAGWTRVGDVPGYSYLTGTNAGAGTANAIQATTSFPVPVADGGALIALPITATNTASPVTVAFNGGTALTVKTNSGNDPVIGGLTAGMIVAGYKVGTTFRLLSDQASAAIQAAAEAAVGYSKEWANNPENTLVSVAAGGNGTSEYSARHWAAKAAAAQPNTFVADRAALKALDTGAVTAAYLREAGREGQFIWRTGDYSAQVASDAAEGVYIKAAAAAATAGAWVRDGVEILNVSWFGATYNGVTDDRAALAAADTTAVALGKSLLISGPLRVASAITVESNQFYAPPGKLVPSANVLVTLSGRPDAGHWQIFDRSQGGAVQFAKGAGTVWAEWWGARAEPSGRTDNNIPIQHAIDACGSVLSSGVMGPAPNGDGNGGTVRFASTNSYLVSGPIQLRNRTILRGNGGYTELKLNTATWSGTEMILSQNGTISQFWCRIEDMIINSSGLATMNRVIYAPAWQESCGLRDVLIRNFYNTAVLVDTFYGGSVGFTLKQVQFFPWATPGNFVMALDISSPTAVARPRILLEDISFAGITDSAPPGLNMVGIRATGRVDLICRGVFVEGYDIGCVLRGGASLYGDFTGPGNPSVGDIIQADSDFVGRIDCVVLKGSAVRVLRSFKTSPSTLQLNAEPFSRRVVYPVTPTEVFAAGRVSGGAGTPAVSNSFGVSSVSKDGTGLYTLTFNTSEFNPGAGSDYRVRVAVQSVNARTWFVNVANSTGVQLQFKNATTDTAADVGDFDFEIVGRPGY